MAGPGARALHWAAQRRQALGDCEERRTDAPVSLHSSTSHKLPVMNSIPPATLRCKA
jgi:hypothetical protein